MYNYHYDYIKLYWAILCNLLENANNKDISFLNKDDFISFAKQKFRYTGKKEAENLLEKTATMLTVGYLSEKYKDIFFQSITEIYFNAKNKARKKYGKKNVDRIDYQK
jgi:hypothetical protein